MKPYFITYDLYRPGQDYKALFEAIKSYPDWCHVLDSVWLVRSNGTAVEIRDHLHRYMDQNDKLFVGGWTNEAAWFGLDTERSTWLRAA
jgi:hypothetical protein